MSVSLYHCIVVKYILAIVAIEFHVRVVAFNKSAIAIISCGLYSASGFWVGKASLQSWRKLLNAAVLGGQEDESHKERAEEGAKLKSDSKDLVNLCHKKESTVSLLTDSEGEGCQVESCQQEPCQPEVCEQVCQQEVCQQEPCQPEVCEQKTCQQEACQPEACQPEVCEQKVCQQEVCQQEACQQEVCQQKAQQSETCLLEDSQMIEKEDTVEGSNERSLENNKEEAGLSLASDKGRKTVADNSYSVKDITGSFNEDVLCAHGVCWLEGVFPVYVERTSVGPHHVTVM